ncbi:uncharacterized protein METZ01_LOCUS493712, partial [marine metagenome]
RGFSDVGFINEEQKTLAARRAIAVKKYLISKGVNKYRLTPVPFPTTVDEISRYSKIKNRFTHDLEFRIKASSNSEGMLLKQLKQDLLDGKFISSPESILSVYEHELRSFEKKWRAERKKLIEEEYIEISAVDIVNKALPKAKEISPESKKENEELDIARQIEKQIEADLTKAEDEFSSNIDNSSFDDEFEEDDGDDEVTFDDLDDIDLDAEEDFFNSKDEESDDIEIDDSDDFDFQ